MPEEKERQADVEKGGFKSVMQLASFFATWDTVVDKDCLRELSDGATPEELFKDYNDGKIKAADVIGTVTSCLRSDTEEAQEKKKFFEDALEMAEAEDEKPIDWDCDICKQTCELLGDEKFCKEMLEQQDAGKISEEEVDKEFSKRYGKDWIDRVTKELTKE